MEVQVLGSGTAGGGGGGGDDSVSRDAEKEVVTVPPEPRVDSSCWKLSFKGVVKTPSIAIVVLVKTSASRPEMMNVAVPVLADVFWKSNGDPLGVHTWPPAAGLAEQPAVPSIPGSRNVSVIVMFGAELNVIKSGTSREPVASGGFVISLIIPVEPARAMKSPCWALAGEFMANTSPVPKAMLPVDRLAVPVIFRTPVSRSPLAVRGIIMNATKLIVAMRLVRVPPCGSSGFRNLNRQIMRRTCRNRHEDRLRTLLIPHEDDANARVQKACEEPRSGRPAAIQALLRQYTARKRASLPLARSPYRPCIPSPRSITLRAFSDSIAGLAGPGENNAAPSPLVAGVARKP
jgi:hypothetical protein